ncbi:MAG: hypothetical protein K1X86_15915 [Ignavibacteria bacterium]|nr:hypothetical protein [Ignavibacteria bacterium]
MKVEYKKIIKIDELAHLVPTKAGATFSQLWQIFYYTRMFKYVSYNHYSQIKSSFNKICTYKKLEELCRLGYLKSPKHEVYCATNKVLPILQEAGFNINLLPNEPIGTGDINELNNTDIFIQAIKRKYFHTLLFPNFKYVIPDALLIEFDKDNAKYKLTFLEIEAKKPKWRDYLEEKRRNYIRLSKSTEVLKYWMEVCSKIGFSKPNLEDFKFNVCFVCTLKENFGNGFNFKSTLNESE